MNSLRGVLFKKIVALSFAAQNALVDKIFTENGVSELGQQIIAEVRKTAAESPGFVYPQDHGSCYYVRNGEPSCIVGHALWNLGLIDAKWKGDDLGVSSIEYVVKNEGWPLTIGEIDWLAKVQDSQDGGWPWGQSIERADDPKVRRLNADEDL